MQNTTILNESDLVKQLDFFNHSLFWFHVFKPTINGKQQLGDIHSEFCSKKDVVDLCKKYNGKGILCIAINERQANKTKKEDVTTISILLFDIDVKKELKADYVSIPEHHEHAIKVAQEKIKPYLEKFGFYIDLIVDSGNGCHIFSKVNIDISTEDKRNDFLAKVTALENDLRQFDDDIIKVDFITKDINRRVKLAGTINKKDTAQKEDRTSKILYLNQKIDILKNNAAFEKIITGNKVEFVRQHTVDFQTEFKEISTNRLQDILTKDLKLKRLLVEKNYAEFNDDRSRAEASIVEKLVYYDFSKEEIFSFMEKYAEKWNEKQNSYRELTFNKAKQKAMECKEKKETEKIYFNYKTEHLPYFDKLRQLSALEGSEYTPILKGLYYSFIGLMFREKKIKVGKLKTDTRFSLTIPLPSGQGKKNIKTCAYKVLQILEYNVDLPLSFHSQQLIGKVINRGTFKKPHWIKNEGFLSRDFLLFDEAFKLLTSKDEEIQESRRAVRIAKDMIGENLVEKKQVDNTFDDLEKLSYYPKVTIIQFLQPKHLPADIVEEGDLRRDLVLYVRSISDRDKTLDYSNRLTLEVNESEILTEFTGYLREITIKMAGLEFKFTDQAIEKVNELHRSLIEQGFIHSEKGANFSKIIDWTLQDFLVKMSCCVGGMYLKANIDSAMVELAFMDLLEFFNLQLDFVKDKIYGQLDYGEGWNGAKETDQKCLEWLWNKGATAEDKSLITINEFKREISNVKNISYDQDINGGQAVKHYLRFVKNGWIEGKQLGQHDSRVWLKFKPKFVGNKLIISEGGKGCPPYRYNYFLISDNINAKILAVRDNHPYTPYHPEERIEMNDIDANENFRGI